MAYADGAKVKVAMTLKGVTTVQDAEVITDPGSGLIHVRVDGQEVSVDPSQIVPADEPIEGMQSQPFPPAADEPSSEALDVLAKKLSDQVMVIVKPILDRVAVIEAKLAEKQVPEVPAAAAAESAPGPVAVQEAPAAEPNPNEQTSTAAAESGEPAAGSQ